MYTTPDISKHLQQETYDMQQLSGSSGRGGTVIPSTIRILSGGGAGLDAGPARRDPKMMPPAGGVGGLPAPVVRPDSSSIRAAMSCCFWCSSASAARSGNGLEEGLDPTGCCIDTK